MTQSDDLSYNYITKVFESGDESSIIVDPGMRRGCSGSIFTFRGGLDNCTMYVVIECQDLCIFNVSLSVQTKRPLNNLIPEEPQLINEGQTISSTVRKG